MKPIALLTLFVGWLAPLGCRDTAVEPPSVAEWRPCLPNGSEFPPDGCALVLGTLNRSPSEAGHPFVLAVDTVDLESRSWFVAAPQPVNADGTFRLLVAQLRPLGSPAVPARMIRVLDIRVYESLDDARNKRRPRAVIPTAMFVTPWGVLVEPSQTTLTVPLPGAVVP